ncbi:hypothetical protein [Arthrobacter sp. G119Y2]|uniref:hypothetical protein n=1 Tax=Arthrobacter sp. G119Y2 TaxID=3134965 RepID=UPI00311912A8
MSIMATRILPTRELRSEEHICRRCGIDFNGRANAEYCTDCRWHVKRSTNQN